MIPESGSSWSYVRIALGDIPAFFCGWVYQVQACSSAALLSLVAAKYLIRPFIDYDCVDHVS